MTELVKYLFPLLGEWGMFFAVAMLVLLVVPASIKHLQEVFGGKRRLEIRQLELQATKLELEIKKLQPEREEQQEEAVRPPASETTITAELPRSSKKLHSMLRLVVATAKVGAGIYFFIGLAAFSAFLYTHFTATLVDFLPASYARVSPTITNLLNAVVYAVCAISFEDARKSHDGPDEEYSQSLIQKFTRLAELEALVAERRSAPSIPSLGNRSAPPAAESDDEPSGSPRIDA